MSFTEKDIERLTGELRARISQKRFRHTRGVEKMSAFLAESLIPNMVGEIRAAALLHDVAKEIPISEQIKLLSECGFSLTDEDKASEGVIHSYSAPYVIQRDFPDFATENILSAVKKHTLGDADMSVFDKIIFISDYTEETRTYESCIKTARFLLADFLSLDYDNKIDRLNRACIMAIDGAEEALSRMRQPINSKMYVTKKSLEKQLLQN